MTDKHFTIGWRFKKRSLREDDRWSVSQCGRRWEDEVSAGVALLDMPKLATLESSVIDLSRADSWKPHSRQE